ncbi:MAG: class A beta-lactamase-related serine hydrolase [Clostridia bacterium]|nr:class A beta-lactamase-related serine hydrolase [Clostridia bacterium]
MGNRAYPKRRRKRRKNEFLRFFVLPLVVMLLIFTVAVCFVLGVFEGGDETDAESDSLTETDEVTDAPTDAESEAAATETTEAAADETTEDSTGTVDFDTLYSALCEAIDALGREVGICAYDLSSGYSFSYNSDYEIWCASSIKAAYVYYVCRLVDSGEASLSDVLTYTSSDTVYGDGLIAARGIGSDFTLEEVIHYTVNISDNEGYYMLVRYYGRSDFDSLMTSLGCDSLKISSSRYPDITAEDLCKIWREIYAYSTETETGAWLYSEFLSVSYMRFIADATGYETANKDGWASPSCNAAGVVYGKNSTYVLVVLSEGSYWTIDLDSFDAIICAVDAIMEAGEKE